MNTFDLLSMLGNKEFLLRYDRTELEKLAAKYPYFFVAHALIAKQNRFHENFSQPLHAAALLANDRAMLHAFIEEGSLVTEKKKGNEEIVAPAIKHKFEPTGLEDEGLMEMLKSIHERKQAFLDAGVRDKEKNQQPEPSEQIAPSEVTSAVTEMPANTFSIGEEDPVKEEAPSPGSDVVINSEPGIEEHAEVELQQDDLVFMNDLSGAGAEYIPTGFLTNEDANEEFAFEQDSEIASIRVIEEEFILRDLEYDFQEKEVEIISVLESPLQLESEKLIPFDTEDAAKDEIEATWYLEEEISDQLSLVEKESPPGQEDIYPPEIEVEIQEELHTTDSSSDLRINEQVDSPGEFLPEKSYSFSRWLQFFRYDKLSKNEAVSEPIIKKQPPVDVTERSFGTSMQHELESIDKMVSAIKPGTAPGGQEISAEDLAKRSSELNEEVVSETLAKIYEEQGRIDKAIRQYVKLSLKYPEKVSFFAARIKELKSKR